MGSKMSAPAATEDPESEGSEMTPLAAIASVGVADLDKEHEECAAALKRLADEKSVAALDEVILCYETHFRHEEELLDAHLYSELAEAADPGFSADAGARKSHWADHARLLAELRKARTQALKANTSDTSCRGAVPPGEVNCALRNFESHAARYDNSYAPRLSAKLTKRSRE